MTSPLTSSILLLLTVAAVAGLLIAVGAAFGPVLTIIAVWATVLVVGGTALKLHAERQRE